MRRGKEIAQGAHASISFLTRRIRECLIHETEHGLNLHFLKLSDTEKAWIEGRFKKICCVVNSEEELLGIHEKAVEAGLVSSLIQDSGATEFHGEQTNTCVAIGPDDDDKIDEIAGHLKLY
jgi:PTH2 family peptidyl-tRNA hydrolase